MTNFCTSQSKVSYVAILLSVIVCWYPSNEKDWQVKYLAFKKVYAYMIL